MYGTAYVPTYYTVLRYLVRLRRKPTGGAGPKSIKPISRIRTIEATPLTLQAVKRPIYQIGTIPDMPIIDNILTIVGHRFGHQSGLYESARHKSAAIRNVFAFRVYVVF